MSSNPDSGVSPVVVNQGSDEGKNVVVLPSRPSKEAFALQSESLIRYRLLSDTQQTTIMTLARENQVLEAKVRELQANRIDLVESAAAEAFEAAIEAVIPVVRIAFIEAFMRAQNAYEIAKDPTSAASQAGSFNNALSDSNKKVTLSGGVLWRGVHLEPQQYKLLTMLMAAEGKIVPYSELEEAFRTRQNLRKIWGKLCGRIRSVYPQSRLWFITHINNGLQANIPPA